MNIPETRQSTESERPAADPHDAPDGSSSEALAVRTGPRSARVFLGGVIAVVACVAAGIVWLVLPHGGARSGNHTGGARPTVPVGYTVSGSGSARITYTRPDGTSRTFTAHLPWQQTTAVTAGRPAAVTIVLGPDGGRATCALTVHGTAVQHATAYGTYGRATCTNTAN
ncbi:hypothetical protein [Streptomyces sp. NPDC020917]|uniref:hypothetical protein n=1 Tax=Streptomyces sp. NPDC020917 TaxID=3365102 RepID=UPI0037AE73C0